MTSLIDSMLQEELIKFCKTEEANKNPKPLKETLIAELLKQIIRGEREITGLVNNYETGDVFVRFSCCQYNCDNYEKESSKNERI